MRLIRLVGLGLIAFGIVFWLPPVQIYINRLSPSCVANSMNCTNSVLLTPVAVFGLLVGIVLWFVGRNRGPDLS